MRSSLHDRIQNPCVYVRYGFVVWFLCFSRSLRPRQWSSKSKRKSKTSKIIKKMPTKKWKPFLKRTSEASGPSSVRSFFVICTSRVWVWQPCDMIDRLRSALQAWRHCWGSQNRWLTWGKRLRSQTTLYPKHCAAVQISLANWTMLLQFFCEVMTIRKRIREARKAQRHKTHELRFQYNAIQ